MRGASDMVTITEDLWAENRDACGAVNRETLRRAAEAALAPLVELSPGADLASALDDLLELVCGRGQDPDVVLRQPRRPTPTTASGSTVREDRVRIAPFMVEQWMNDHETTATWNTAETCVDSLRLDELLELSGEGDDVLRRLLKTRLAYGDIVGSPRLRAAIAALYGERVTAADVVTANGAIGANSLALLALVEPGDTVVCVKPTYQQLYAMPEALGATVRSLRLREADGYLPVVDELRALVDERTRLIVLNNPNNPTGALMGEALLREIVEVARAAGAWILCDEVYRRLEHEPGPAVPSIVDVYEKGVSSGSTSKSFSLAGSAHWLDRRTARAGGARVAMRTHHHQLRRARRRAGDGRPRVPRRRLSSAAWGSCAATSPWSTSGCRRSPPALRAAARRHYGADIRTTCAALVSAPPGHVDFNGAFLLPGAAFEEKHAFRLGYACARDVLSAPAAISEYPRTLHKPALQRSGGRPLAGLAPAWRCAGAPVCARGRRGAVPVEGRPFRHPPPFSQRSWPFALR